MEVNPALGLVLLLGILGLVAWAMLRRRSPSATGATAGQIVWLDGPERGKRFPVRGPSVTFGRAAGQNSIVLAGNLISRQHAALSLTANGPVLQDYDSTNGTWVGGRRVIGSVTLAPGQPFQIGPHVFAYYPQNQAAPVSSKVLPPAQPVAPAVSPSIARNLDIGQYDRVRLLGDGGAAVVYLVRHRVSGEELAVKFLRQDADQYFRLKFAAEGKIGMDLRHPHIVEAYDDGQANGVPYIFMEYMPGGSLRDQMAKGGLTSRQIVTILGEVCQALQYAHNHNPPIFHRDIKPENILFDQHGKVKLADFGIARVAGQQTLTRQGMIVGTPDYMSAEQARGATIDGHSDQYSLGIVLYEILCGRVPFSGPPLTVVEKHLSEKPVPPSAINPGVDKNLEKVALKALEKDPRRRFSSMSQMAKALGYRTVGGSSILPSRSRTAPARAKSQPRSQIVEVGTGRILELSQPEVVLGRSWANYDTVSRQHARIRQANGRATIEDLGSHNGTFVNGRRLTPRMAVPLAHGDVIKLGPVASYQFSLQ